MGHHHHGGDAPPVQHRKAGPKQLKIFVVTVSDTRDESTDKSGAWLQEAAREAGHEVVGYRIVKDEEDQVLAALDAGRDAGAQVVLTNGGTGIAARDRTYEAVQRRLDKELSGFGELFRMLSYEDIGAAAMLSRATAGLWGGLVVACLPGSTGAVKLAWEKLLKPELGHLVGLAQG